MAARFCSPTTIFALAALACIVTFVSPAHALPPQAAPGGRSASAATPQPGELSNDEHAAVAFMRTILAGERLYKKKHNEYVRQLSTLAGTGSVTTRMVKARERAGYRVGYTSTGENFVLTMTPITPDPQHRAFYANHEGVIRMDEGTATAQSPPLKTGSKR